MAVDAFGRPLAIRVTAGQAGDNPQLLPVLDEISVPTGHRPRSRPDTLIADKAYSHPSTRKALRGRGIATVIPERNDQIARRAARGSAGGRPPAFDPDIYKQRNVVEVASAASSNGVASPLATTRRPATTAPASSWAPSSCAGSRDPPDRL